MLQITSIKNGFVLDHIKAGKGIEIFNFLGLDKGAAQVALIMNAESNTMGRKDIIKIDGLDKIDYTTLAIISPGITINEVKNETIVNKIVPDLPNRIEDVIVCKNTRCITNVEKYVPQVFLLMDKENGTYRCEYCDHLESL